MNPRKLQLLISAVETEYTENNHTSFSQTILYLKTTTQAETDTQLLQQLKFIHGPPGGNISYTVGKQTYNYLTRTDTTLLDIVTSAAKYYERPPQTITDDLLVRYMRSKH
jgi:hypothetical protein